MKHPRCLRWAKDRDPYGRKPVRGSVKRSVIEPGRRAAPLTAQLPFTRLFEQGPLRHFGVRIQTFKERDLILTLLSWTER